MLGKEIEEEEIELKGRVVKGRVYSMCLNTGLSFSERTFWAARWTYARTEQRAVRRRRANEVRFLRFEETAH